IYSGEEFILNYKAGFGPCAKLIRRDLFFNHSLFFKEGIVPEDIELVPKLILTSQRVLISSVVFYNYVYNPFSVTKSNQKSRFKNRIDGLLVVAKSLNDFSLQYLESNSRIYHFIHQSIIRNVILELFHFIEYRTYVNRQKLKSIFAE